MAYALVVNTGKGSTNATSVTTDAVDSTGADLLIATVADYSADSSTLTDSKSNTWTALTARTQGNIRQQLYYSKNPTVGTGHTFTATSAGASYPALCMAAFSGANTTAPFDVENTAIASGATSIQPGSISPANADELVVTGIGLDPGNTLSIDGSFSISDSVLYSGGFHFAGALAYKIPGGASENPTWSWATASSVAVGIAAFKTPGGGGTAVPVFYKHLQEQGIA